MPSTPISATHRTSTKTRHLFATLLAGWLLLAVAAWAEDARWVLRSPLETGRSEIAVAVLDDRIHVTGGIESFGITDTTERYDPANDAWSTLAPLPRELHHVALVSCGETVWASGGYGSLWFSFDDRPTLWRYEAPEDRWLEEAPLPGPLGEHAMACIDGQPVLIGGNTPEGASDEVWRFEGQAIPRWIALPPMPTPRHSAAVAWARGRLYVMGGRNDTDGAHLDAVESYDPVSGEWSEHAPLPVGRGGHAAATLGGRVHVLGGELLDSGEVLDRHDIYDPETGTWSEGTPLAEARHGLAAAVVDERLYAIGGGSRPGLQTIYSVTGTVQELRWGDPASTDESSGPSSGLPAP